MDKHPAKGGMILHETRGKLGIRSGSLQSLGGQYLPQKTGEGGIHHVQKAKIKIPKKT